LGRGRIDLDHHGNAVDTLVQRHRSERSVREVKVVSGSGEEFGFCLGQDLAVEQAFAFVETHP
jgi:hypothetical protein